MRTNLRSLIRFGRKASILKTHDEYCQKAIDVLQAHVRVVGSRGERCRGGTASDP